MKATNQRQSEKSGGIHNNAFFFTAYKMRLFSEHS